MKIAQEYAATDKRIKIIKNAKEEGLSFSRNNGMRNSTAPYIMFCDSDDEYKPNMCAEMLAGIETGADCAVCATKVVCFDDFPDKSQESNSYFDVAESGLFLVRQDLISKTAVMAWNKIYRRSIVEKYNLQFPVGLYYEDNSFWFAYGLLCEKIFFIKERLYIYNRHSDSITSDALTDKTASSHIDYLKNAIYLYEWLVKSNLYEGNFEFYGWCFKYFLIHSLTSTCIVEQNIKIAYDIAESFIDGKRIALTPNELDDIKNRHFHNRDECYRFVGVPIIKIKKSLDKCDWCLLGVSVYKKKYSINWCKHYIFGLYILKIRLV
jgi:glycosyltransferase involved in cell wall biosynthesis